MNARGELTRTVAAPRRWTAVVSAMYVEIAPLVARCAVENESRLGSVRVRAGRIEGADVVLAWTGEGAELATRGLTALLDALPAVRVLGLGVAGGLSPALQPGDIVVGSRLWQGAHPVAASDARWVDRALALGGARGGTLVTSSRMLCTAAEKAAAWALLRGSAEAAAVDLETAAWAKVAGQRGLPFLAVRAVCDTACEDLPFDLNDCVDPAGRVSRFKVARKAILQPSAMRELWSLRRRVTDCSRRLADFVVPLLGEGQP
jgi:adenosylhomocysteine nucleosidase